VRTQPLDLSDASTASAVLSLQRAAYAVEAALVGDDRIPPLHEELPALQSSGLHWLGGVEDDAVVAAVAWAQDDGVVDVHRLIVTPERHGRGLGRALMTALLAQTSGPVVVSTGRDNVPACRLYAGLGFTDVGEGEVVPGLWVRRFRLDR